MARWSELEELAPALGQAGEERVPTKIVLLATVRNDGSPRVHPVRPFVSNGQLLLFSGPESPKTKDLRRNGMYAIHPSFDPSSRTGGEFSMGGKAREITDPEQLASAAEVSPFKIDYGALFELEVGHIVALVEHDGGVARARWSERDGFRIEKL